MFNAELPLRTEVTPGVDLRIATSFTARERNRPTPDSGGADRQLVALSKPECPEEDALAPDSAKHKTFLLKLSDCYMEYFRNYAFVYRHMLERIGRDAVEETWRSANERFEDELFLSLLESGWAPEEAPTAIPSQREQLLGVLFESPIQGVTAHSAKTFLLSVGPFSHFEKRFRALASQRECTAYKALHLLAHGLACFAEAAIERFGRAAEFMIYDGLVQEVDDRLTPEGTGREWVKAIYDRVEAAKESAPAASEAPETPEKRSDQEKPALLPNIGSAGHIEEVIRVTEDEVIVHMTQCSWADYYLDRHPTVGQLLGCCIDDPVYRRTADGLRLQRQFTLMEDGPHCDFRFYPVDSSKVH